ncbi:MAG: hypothetical protein BROFUL_00168 [Candidatus Brocadia fulgida]|uniref:Uncharacterized protein n=1 Tax=Candidatus Brocadia fulgida TaxID=380242 RepID=A0A0M2UZ89_9BACT|nr:MAG: hypothetical protein BROFUL_00168 [Candidatus Brocadia fulgida]
MKLRRFSKTIKINESSTRVNLSLEIFMGNAKLSGSLLFSVCCQVTLFQDNHKISYICAVYKTYL